MLAASKEAAEAWKQGKRQPERALATVIVAPVSEAPEAPEAAAVAKEAKAILQGSSRIFPQEGHSLRRKPSLVEVTVAPVSEAPEAASPLLRWR